MNSVLISARNIGLCYKLKRPVAGSRDYWALRDVSLEVRQGETLGVIGSNGAGKSTLMKLLAGIIIPDRGEIITDPGLRVILLSIGTGFENPLTGRENAVLSGMLLGLHRRTIEKRLPRIIEFSELGDFIDQPIYTYSAGMRARLGFSVAMEADPDILLLDEIMGVGDIHFREKSSNLLRAKIRSDTTVVLISHDPKTIGDLCTRATWIHAGLTRMEGSPADVSAAYTTFMKSDQRHTADRR
jgi:lipopolysaccharide transport system ATP-binding protein